MNWNLAELIFTIDTDRCDVINSRQGVFVEVKMLKIIRWSQYMEVLALDLIVCLCRSPVFSFPPVLCPHRLTCAGSSTCFLPSAFSVGSASGKPQQEITGEGKMRSNYFFPCKVTLDWLFSSDISVTSQGSLLHNSLNF